MALMWKFPERMLPHLVQTVAVAALLLDRGSGPQLDLAQQVRDQAHKS